MMSHFSCPGLQFHAQCYTRFFPCRSDYPITDFCCRGFWQLQPSGYSVFHWVRFNENPTDAWVVLGAIVAFLANIALIIAAWKTLGKVGTAIVLIFLAPWCYLSLQEGWVESGNNVSLQWLALILYSGFLGIGLSGAIIWRRVTGQVVTDEADDIDN